MEIDEAVTLNAETLPVLRQFSGKLSHDFNNLLTPLLAYPALIKMKSNPDEQTSALLDVIERTAGDMAHIMRQLTRLSSQHEPAAPFDYLTCYTDGLQQVLRELGAEERVHVSVETRSFPVSVALEQLDLILGSLLHNAIDASDGARSPVEIVLSTAVLQESRVCANGEIPAGSYGVLRVVDHGRGLPDDALPAIFEPFFTTRRALRKRGAGLGLSIVLAFLSDCAGYIDFQSTAGGGTTVDVFIPLASARSDAEVPGAAGLQRGAASAVEPCSYGGRVLVVDDEAMIVESFSMMLTTALPGIDVAVAHDGVEAVEMFDKVRPGVMVMDLHMPRMDGFTAFGEIREHCRTSGIPMPRVIFCTGYAPTEAVRGVREDAGDHDLIFKPVTGMELVDLVKPHLQVVGHA
jgi:two-component system cell cycle sensor histidine kinase/response regulator CckA